MDLSIIIVSYRGWTHLKECLDSLAAFTGKRFRSEVIIVDNNSSDGVIDEFKLNWPEFKFIKNEINGGFANGCNLGSAAAKGDYFLFLNPDTIASEEEIGKLLERAKKYPENYISSCRQINKKGEGKKVFGLFPEIGTLTGLGRVFYRFLNKKKIAERINAVNNVIHPDWVSGSVMMIKKEVFRKLGGFDEDFWMYSEDIDLCRRARDQHGEIACYTDIKIQHNHGGSSRIDLKTTALTKTEVIISGHLYIAKHKSGMTGYLIQSYLVFLNLTAGIVMTLFTILFFASPKIFVKASIFFRLITYYFGAIMRRSWISPRSVNFIKNN
jgi:GT2 family glycosyltransferase